MWIFSNIILTLARFSLYIFKISVLIHIFLKITILVFIHKILTNILYEYDSKNLIGEISQNNFDQNKWDINKSELTKIIAFKIFKGQNEPF